MTRSLPKILHKIIATKETEVATLLAQTPLATLENAAATRLRVDPPRPFTAALTATTNRPHVIAEVKKASPSKGVIRADFNPTRIAAAYQQGGAAALSCLTDETYFQGKLEYLRAVREASGLPVLRKDFIIHPAQIFEACAAGADAILLISRILTPDDLRELYRLAKSLRLDVLLEIHDLPDLQKALSVQPNLLGVNNRDLDTFQVDIATTFRLREETAAAGIPLVSESGITCPADLARLAAAGIHAVLVGEQLMRQTDIAAGLRELRGGAALKHSNSEGTPK